MRDGSWAKFRTCIIAPQAYVEGTIDAAAYDVRISYESIHDWFQQRAAIGKRYAENAVTMQKALGRHQTALVQAMFPSGGKDPEEWVTGEEPATPKQLHYLRILADKAGEQIAFDQIENMPYVVHKGNKIRGTKANLSKLIDDFRQRAGRPARSMPGLESDKGRS